MKKFTIGIIAVVLSAGLSACGGEKTQDVIEPTISPGVLDDRNTDAAREENINSVKEYLQENYANFNIDGSTSMIPLHQSLNDLFASTEETISHSKTVEAFEKFINGDNDILLGVDYSDELLEKAKDSGIELVKKEITREAFVFLINKHNPVKSITVEQIKDIYSGKITNWNEVGGDNAPIKAYQRNSDSGSQIQMLKFMGSSKLKENDVEYISIMSEVIEQIANYDRGKYSIAYNMYTFTEKQYTNDEVVLLDVNGIHPNDDSIFDETYPLVIYNYIYYDANNASASEFADSLYSYLMSNEGQKLISGSGYVNLNIKYDTNKDIEKPYEDEYVYGHEVVYGFHNIEKGEFYDISDDGELLIFNSYIDFAVHGTKYENDKRVREFISFIANSEFVERASAASINEANGTIFVNPWSDGSLDADDFFSFMYDDKYYSRFDYYIEDDRYVLTSYDKETFDSYMEHGDFDGFERYTEAFEPDLVTEITRDDLKNLYMRKSGYDFMTENGAEIIYIQPFRTE